MYYCYRSASATIVCQIAITLPSSTVHLVPTLALIPHHAFFLQRLREKSDEDVRLWWKDLTLKCHGLHPHLLNKNCMLFTLEVYPFYLLLPQAVSDWKIGQWDPNPGQIWWGLIWKTIDQGLKKLICSWCAYSDQIGLTRSVSLIVLQESNWPT